MYAYLLLSATGLAATFFAVISEGKIFFIGPLDAYVLNCVLVFKTTLLFPFIGKNVEEFGRNFKDTLVLVVTQTILNYKVIDLSKK